MGLNPGSSCLEGLAVLVDLGLWLSKPLQQWQRDQCVSANTCHSTPKTSLCVPASHQALEKWLSSCSGAVTLNSDFTLKTLPQGIVLIVSCKSQRHLIVLYDSPIGINVLIILFIIQVEKVGKRWSFNKMWMDFQISFKSLNSYYLGQYAAQTSTYLSTAWKPQVAQSTQHLFKR